MSNLRQEALDHGYKINPATGYTNGELASFEAGFNSRDEEVKDLVEWVRTAKTQIEYLNGKFTCTGSSNTILSQLDAFLTKYPL